ncbi:MAG: glycoside hydrolase family 172 protein [Candidatus Onthovivens sp.]
MIGHDLSNIYLKKKGIRKRVSSYDKTGGNDDRIYIKPNEDRVIFDVHTSGLIEHIWMTQMNFGDVIEKNAFRKVYLKFYWEDSTYPSVLVPLGDFFGLGHGISKNYVSEPLQMSPQDGRGLNCYFPMPFKKAARIEVVNECDTTLMLYFYIDYEEKELDEEIMYFNAYWHRECPTKGKDYHTFPTREDFLFKGENKTNEGNYVLLDVEGEGHYVGCNLNIHNLSDCDSWDWIGEGDDVIFIDNDPSLTIYGTGTEDYFSTSWCPSEEYNAPYHGIILKGKDNWKGKTSYYRYHIKDPITFRKSIKVTIEHGHNNNRCDDYSSTAYFYMSKPYQHKVPISAKEDRIPLDDN